MTSRSITTSQPKKTPRLWDVNDLAEYLGVSVATIYRKRSLGEPLPAALRIGSRVRWRPEVVESWLAEQEALPA